jgi:hypothetical protein
MFGFFKKHLWREMSSYCVLIQLATFQKFYRDFVPEFGGDEGKSLAAAVSNRLFSMPRSRFHKNIATVRVDELAQNFVKLHHDSNVFLGIVLSLRTAAVIAADEQDAESVQRIRDTIQWMASIVSLPPDEPNPRTMKKLAIALSHAYPAPKGDEA